MTSCLRRVAAPVDPGHHHGVLRRGGPSWWRRQSTAEKALAVAVGLATVMAAVGAVVPPSPATPTGLNAAAAVMGVLVLTGLLAVRRWEPARLHLTAVAIVVVASIVVARAATGEGAMTSAIMLIWVGLHGAAFHPTAVARAYQVAIALCLGVAMSASPVLATWAVAWLAVVTSSIAGSEVIGSLTRSLRRSALTDPLTGLGNRQHLAVTYRRASAEARRTGSPLSLAVIDLDGLKAINDGEGHVVGDGALVATADALSRAFGDDAVVGRLGGDEFLVIGWGLDTDAVAASLSALQDDDLPDFSFGVCDVLAAGGEELSDVIATADRAMYVQKRSRRQP